LHGNAAGRFVSFYGAAQAGVAIDHGKLMKPEQWFFSFGWLGFAVFEMFDGLLRVKVPF
jgi:hypothetical protein